MQPSNSNSLKCICPTTLEAFPLIHAEVYGLKTTYTNLPYKATGVPSPTCPKSTVAFRYWDWKWRQDERWRGLGRSLSTCPSGRPSWSHLSLWGCAKNPAEDRKEKEAVSQNTEHGPFPWSPFSSVLQHPSCARQQAPNPTVQPLATGVKYRHNQIHK